MKRPPRSSREAIQALQQADERYENNKWHLFGLGKTKINEEEQDDDATNTLENVPDGISFGRLVYPPTKSEIILVGAKRRALMHSSFINDLLFDMGPECTLIQMPPDHPMFIRPTEESEKDYLGEWYQFLRKGKDSQFYVNPHPKYASDTVLTKQRVKSIVDKTLKPSPA